MTFRFTTALGSLLFATSIVAFGQSVVVPVEDVRTKDSYAIYSLAVTSAVVPSGHAQFLIFEKTATASFFNPANSCRPIFIGTNPWEDRWNEVQSDWNTRKIDAPINLKRLFTLEKPYLFLDDKEAGTLALVFVSVSCGAMCGNGGWKVYEKTPSGWRTTAFFCSGYVN